MHVCRLYHTVCADYLVGALLRSVVVAGEELYVGGTPLISILRFVTNTVLRLERYISVTLAGVLVCLQLSLCLQSD